MFLDLRDSWPPVPPSPPPAPPRQPKLTRRGERVIGIVVAVNLGMMLVAPIAGSSVVQACAAVIAALHH